MEDNQSSPFEKAVILIISYIEIFLPVKKMQSVSVSALRTENLQP